MGKALLVLGNGFDLCHGLKTRYIDFINHIKSIQMNSEAAEVYTSITNPLENPFVKYFIRYPGIIDNWIDLESTLYLLIKRIEQFINYSYWPEGVRPNVEIGLTGVILQSFFQCFDDLIDAPDSLEQYLDPQSINNIRFKKEFYHDFYAVDKHKIIKHIRDKFDEFTKIFSCYIFHISKTKIEPIDQFKKIDVGGIITFNYTETYKNYEEFALAKIIHVHGKCEDNCSSIILGYHDENEDELDFVYFKKYFQEVLKFEKVFKKSDCALNSYSDCALGSDPTELFCVYPSEVHFIGHSLDISDSEKLKTILFLDYKCDFTKSKISSELLDKDEYKEDKDPTKFYFYYRDAQDKESKYVNLMKLVTKDVFLEKLNSGIFTFVSMPENTK